MLDYFYMNTDFHLALMAEPIGNVPLPPGTSPVDMTYTSVGLFGWVVFIVFIAVLVLGPYGAIRFLKKGYYATTGFFGFVFTVVLWFSVNLLWGEFRDTALRYLVRDFERLVNSVIVPILFLASLMIIFYGIYRLEKRVQQHVSVK